MKKELRTDELQPINACLREEKKPVSVHGLAESGLPHAISRMTDGFAKKVIVTFDANKAAELAQSLRAFEKDVFYYPARDFIFYSADVHGSLTTQERLTAISALLTKEQVTIVTSIGAMMDKLIPLSSYQSTLLNLKVGDFLDLGLTTAKLIHMGYERVNQVESPGQFAIRGDILDIFSLVEEVPVRVDLFDDEIDNIKYFDADSQRSIENIEEISIYSASELILDQDRLEEGMKKIKKELDSTEKKLRKEMKTSEAFHLKTSIEEILEQLENQRPGLSLDSFINYFYEDTVTLSDYFHLKETAFVLIEPKHCLENAITMEKEFSETMKVRINEGYHLPGQKKVLLSAKKSLEKILDAPVLLLSSLDSKNNFFQPVSDFQVHMQGVSPYHNSMETLSRDLLRYRKQNYSIALLTGSRTRAARLVRDLNSLEIPAFESEDPWKIPLPKEVMVSVSSLAHGFEYSIQKYVVITENDIFSHIKKKKKIKKPYKSDGISDFQELKAGDYVVHENHGLGIYQGIEKIESNGTTKDYLKIKYAGQDVLYVPTNSLDMISKYSSSEGRAPRINKLDSIEWHKTKSKVKTAVNEIAKDLVALYAARQSKEGFVYEKDGELQHEFEENFPFDETNDQLTAVADIKADMESTKIMDRLICGDVGFGKTEVAMRAIFKAILSGKQVAVLAPTTILAQQHYNTMLSRFSPFGLIPALLSRFRTPKQIQQTIEGLKDGSVELVIGTHRLLSNDVSFKNLGLLVVDEEQRFGVRHKEKIKQYKDTVDVVTLTATPIPRTLHMSLIGIRDMSVLEEAPMDRNPIQTYVMEYNDEMVKLAIKRELSRGGQVYYVYNRVKNIDEIAAHIQELVPDAKVAYAHGKMSSRKVEQITYDFINGEIDVLISTTIVETGMDIPNANTMIIHDADKLGLSQMYQLRGRVGRSSRVAYAFLLYRKDKILKEVAEKRLSAIKEFTDLGAGFKIAMKDLEIRGAGNVLGTVQHGHMEAVGYDLYCKMLNQAVLVEKGGYVQKDFETSVDLPISAFLPPDYIKNEKTKLDIYKRIAEIHTNEERMDMEDELIDRFGDPPKSVLFLLKIAVIKSLAHENYITDLKGDKHQVRMVLFPQALLDVGGIAKIVASSNHTLRFQTGPNPEFLYVPDFRVKTTEDFLQGLEDALVKIASLRLPEDRITSQS